MVREKDASAPLRSLGNIHQCFPLELGAASCELSTPAVLISKQLLSGVKINKCPIWVLAMP